MQRILITGVSGFIGRHLANYFLKKGYEVTGISRTDPNIPGLNFIKADITTKEDLKELCEDKDAVIHLAGITTHEGITKDPEAFEKETLEGLKQILDAFNKSTAKQFIYTSSGKVYGKPESLPYKENQSTTPETILGKVKKKAEELIKEQNKKSSIILRIFQVYGEGQKEQFVIPTILKQLQGEKLILGDIKAKRDYINIHDVCTAIETILKNQNQGTEIYNLGSSKPTSVEDIIKILEKILNKKIQVETDPSKLRKNEEDIEYADITKLKSLGWQPTVDLEEGLKELCKQ